MKNFLKFLQYHLQNEPETLYEMCSWLLETEGDSTYDDYVIKCLSTFINPMSPTLYKECKMGPKPIISVSDDDWHVGDIIY